jgi:hypothetical protein
MKEPSMTALELEAYGKIVHALALTMNELQTSTSEIFDDISEPPPYFYTWHMSTLERGAEFLWSLKILRSLNEANTLFKLDCKMADVPAISEKNAADGPTLDNLVWLYVELRSEFNRTPLDGTTLFSIGRDPAFFLREDESAAFDALKELGYFHAVPGGYAPTARTEALLSKPWWEE